MSITIEPTEGTWYSYAIKSLEKGLISQNIPPYMYEDIKRYVIQGGSFGDFLTALFSNDFMAILVCADDVDLLLIRNYRYLLFNHTPAGCHGSPERMKSWRGHNGLDGLFPEEAALYKQEREADAVEQREHSKCMECGLLSHECRCGY